MLRHRLTNNFNKKSFDETWDNNKKKGNFLS